MQTHARVPLEEFTSGDLSLLKGGSAQNDEPLQTNLTPYQKPPELLLQLNKASSYFFNSTLAAFMRGMASPPPLKEANAVNVPEWFKQQYLLTEQKVNFSKRFVKDASAFFVSCYLIDIVKATAKTLRGVDDVWNSVMGGTAAGLFIGKLWHPHNVQGRGLILFGGALYGFLTQEMQDYSKRYLLEQQQSLERDVLHKSTEELQPALNMQYLQELMRLRHQAFQKDHAQKNEADGAGAVAGASAGVPGFFGQPARSASSSEAPAWPAATRTVSGGQPWLVINDSERESNRA